MMKSAVQSRGADVLLALAGVVIVAVEIYVLAFPPAHMLLLALGTLMIYVGIWRFTGRLVHKRANRVLRGEVDQFISLVRRLYGERTRGDSAGLHETKAALRESLERIIADATYRGKPGGQQAEVGIS